MESESIEIKSIYADANGDVCFDAVLPIGAKIVSVTQDSHITNHCNRRGEEFKELNQEQLKELWKEYKAFLRSGEKLTETEEYQSRFESFRAKYYFKN